MKTKLQVWSKRSKERAKLNDSKIDGAFESVHTISNNNTEDCMHSVQQRLIRHVPDFVWATEEPVIDTPKAIMTNGVLLFADVSGFTALTERYSKHREGVSGLTNALNRYISQICQRILESGGDILKFAGDAILALWKCERDHLAECIALATHCSLEIQNNHDYEMTSVGVELRVKIAISAGKIYCTHVGIPGNMRHIAMSGNPVGEVNAAEKHCESGDVVLSPNAWDICQRETFRGYEVGDGGLKFFKVKFLTRKHFSVDECKAKNPYPTIGEASQYGVLRDACILYGNKTVEKYFRQYISKTVQEKLDDGQPREYLSEIRQCTILFINLVFDLKEQRRDYTTKLGDTLQASFEIVDEELRRKGGQLNKLFMFDKGCTFLAAFGLPGTKDEREAALALMCAYKISTRMTQEISELNRCSIGVTTGSVYVGVIGHEERHEYSFLGPKVNMAARIMMAGYPGMVNCDELTMKCSELSPDYFIAQKYKPLKGIKDPGTIYQYTATIPPLTSYLRRNVKPEYPILGRIDEIDRIMAEICSGEDRCFVIIEGDKGIGKTRLLEEIVVISQNIDVNLHVVNISTSYDIMKDDYKIVRIIIEDLLGIVEQVDRSPGSDAEKSIMETLKGAKFTKEELALINPILGTYLNNQPMDQSILDPRTREKQGEIMSYLLSKCLDNFERSLICIDCAQFIDDLSWSVLDKFSNDPRASIVMAYRPQSHTRTQTRRLTAFDHAENLRLNLRSLPSEYFAALACQMLRVSQISETLTAALIYKSCGQPGWVLMILKQLIESNFIQKVQRGTYDNQNFHEPPKELITSRKLDAFRPSMSLKRESHDSGSGRPSSRERQASSANRGSALTRSLSKSIVNRSVVEKKTEELEYKHPAVAMISEEEEYGQAGRTMLDDNAFSKKLNTGRRYTDILKRIGGYYENVLSQNNEAENADELECAIIKETALDLPKLLTEIKPPQVIKSFILEQLDRLPPTTQQVAKESALVGEFFSRQIIYHLNNVRTSDQANSKVDRAFQQLIDAKIIEPIKTSVSMSRNANDRSCAARKSSLVKKINIKVGTQCDHLRFINPFYHEVIDNLWLEEQRLKLHEICANYFKSSLDEVRAGYKVSSRTITEFAVHREARRDTMMRQKSVSNILNINVHEFEERKVTFDPSQCKKPLWSDNFGLVTKTAVVDDWPEANEVDKRKLDQLGPHKSAESVIPEPSLPRALKNSIKNRGEMLDTKAVASLEKTIFDHSKSGVPVSGVLPGEADLFQAVLCPVVMRHFEASRNTELTIRAALESADAFLRTSNIKDSLSFLDKADDIIVNLEGKGIKGIKYDIVKGQEEGETNFHNLDESVTVYRVPKQTRAYYEMLYGDARVLMGPADRRRGRRHYLAACEYLGESKLGQLTSCSSSGNILTEEDRLQKIELWRRIGQNEMNTSSNADQGNQLGNVVRKLMQITKTCRPWYEIDARIFALYQCSLDPVHRNQIYELEKQVTMLIKDIGALQYDDVYAIHKFYTTACYSRLGMGDVPGAKKLALYLIKLSQLSQSQTLSWMSELLLCEVLLVEMNFIEFYQRIRRIETSIDNMEKPNQEIKCLINTLKLNVILACGVELDNFSDIVLWILPFGASNFTNLQIASFSSSVALINFRMSATDAAYAWHKNAERHLFECPLTYNYVNAFSRLLECDLIIYRNELYAENMPFNYDEDKTKTRKAAYKNVCSKMNQFEDYCRLFPSFTPTFCLFKAFKARIESTTVTAEPLNHLKTGLSMAKQFNNKLVTGYIQANIDYEEQRGKNNNNAGDDGQITQRWTINTLKRVGIISNAKAPKNYTHFVLGPPGHYPWDLSK